MSETLLPCPFCGGEVELRQTGQRELTIRCVGPQPSGLRGCGPKYVQKDHRFSLEWLGERMAETWNRRTSVPPVNADNVAASIVRAACELDDLPDPDDDDTLTITIQDLEAVAHRHITAALENPPVSPSKAKQAEETI